jgi:hypothetical protein
MFVAKYAEEEAFCTYFTKKWWKKPGVLGGVGSAAQCDLILLVVVSLELQPNLTGSDKWCGVVVLFLCLFVALPLPPVSPLLCCLFIALPYAPMGAGATCCQW